MRLARSLLVRSTVAALVTSVLVALLVRQANWQECLAMARQAPLPLLFGALALYLAFNFLRTLRYRVLLGQEDLSPRPLFAIALVHNFLTRTLPFMAGEVSYVILLRRYLGIDAGRGISSLLGARLLEALFVATGGLLGLVTLGGETDASAWMLGGLVLAIFVASAGTVLLSGRLLRTITGWIFGPGDRPDRVHTSRFRSLRAKADGLASALEQLRHRRRLVPAAGLSVLTYLTSFGFHVLLLEAAGFDRSPAVLLVVVSLSTVALWVPFTLSGFGAVEGGWVLGLTVFADVGLTQAVNMSLFLHGGLVVAVVLTGLLGLILMSVWLPSPGRASGR